MFKKLIICFLSIFFIISGVPVLSYASTETGSFKIIIDATNAPDSPSKFNLGGVVVYDNQNVFVYLIPKIDSHYHINTYDLYVVSDSVFTASYATNGVSSSRPSFDSINFRNGCTVKNSNGYFYSYSGNVYFADGSVMNTEQTMPFIVWDSSELPWLNDDFVLGTDPSVGGGSSIVYDSSIPAPQNLTFKSESVGGFLGVGSKWEHTLSWSNGLATPPLFARIYASAEVVFTDTGQFFEDSTIPLVRQEDVFKAETGRYSIGTDELSSKIMDGTVLNKVLQYRVQFCRYDSDGKLLVGPISTVHIKQNLFGKYDGYTVTTEYPKDESDLGQSGGMDDSYVDKWTSDGERYDEYDKDGNHIGSGQSDDVSPIQKILNFIKDIPRIINSLFDSLMGLMSGVGQIPSLLSQLFSFLPVEIISLIGLGLTVVIVLRIFGR